MMRQLICVGGPCAGEIFNVQADQAWVLLPGDRDPDTADWVTPPDSVLYAVSGIAFQGRRFRVLLWPELRTQPKETQDDAILKALLRPEAYDAWTNGHRPEAQQL